MMWFFGFQVVFGMALLIYVLRQRRRLDLNDYLQEYTRVHRPKATHSIQQAIDVRSLIGQSFTSRIYYFWLNLLDQLGAFALVKLILFLVLVCMLARFFNDSFFQGNIWIVTLIFLLVCTFLGSQFLRNRREKEFEESFPVALNMMTSAVSSGESLTHAISYVGATLEGRVAREFSNMGKRLQLGEAPEDVFRKACARLPYPMFFFFVMALRANMERGGQLKDIIQRLNKLMFNIRAIEKKKSALTAEARTSAKIVAAIPFIFIIVMRFFSPENYDFIMSDSRGRMLLYYMFASEFIGILIIWGLMRSAR